MIYTAKSGQFKMEKSARFIDSRQSNMCIKKKTDSVY